MTSTAVPVRAAPGPRIGTGGLFHLKRVKESVHQTRATKGLQALWSLLLVLPVCLRAGDLATQYKKEIRPLLQKHCYECHGPEKHKADLNLASFDNLEQIQAAPQVWETVLERVQAYEMPPKSRPGLEFTPQQHLVEWLRALPRSSDGDCDQVASDRNTSSYHGYVMSRRLNRAEYSNTIRDLLGLDLRVEDLLPKDGGGGEGFDTSGSALFTSSIHIEKYLSAANRIVSTVLVDDPAGASAEITKARQRILIAEPTAERSARQAAFTILESFMHRAFRRAVTPAEVERYLRLFDRSWERGDGFLAGVRLAIKGVLVAPDFLFLPEPAPDAGGVQALAAEPLASRLSYFLWSSMPDDELLALAENGDLLKHDVYRGQVHRMLADPKAQALGGRFALQWLDLDRLGADVRPDPKKFPEFNADLCRAMLGEVTRYFNYLFQSDASLLELIDSDFTFATPKLAALYGVKPSCGNACDDSPRRVQLADHNRGGLVGMAAVHAVTSFPTRTSPVLRGRWILEALLGEKVPPPPENVPALPDVSGSSDPQTLREQLEVHRSRSECAGCHSKMDPLGFGLENFDVLGRWRDEDRGQPIDAQGTLPSGQQFTGPAGLKRVLLQQKDQFIRHLTRKMTGFALGRELNRFDECTVNRTVEALKQSDYRPSILVEQIATSYQFTHRFYPKDN